MTATDELCKLLDERGVEWSSIGGDTAWEDSRGWTATAEADSVDGSMVYVTALMTPEQAIEATLGPREQPPYDELIEALRRDWDIEASWDGLRRFWYVGLTDEGVRKRDEREATLGRETCRITDERYKECMALVQDLLHHIEYPPCEGCLLEMSCAGDLSQCDEYFDWLKPRARELGVEVDG